MYMVGFTIYMCIYSYTYICIYMYIVYMYIVGCTEFPAQKC